MPLERYHQKRDFEVTPEPRGKLARPAGALRFVIQKHAATRLHYDFRLELGGVLLSWAVPKGPSLNPGDRRLAVHVEDHPVEYGGFEGIIPQGEYGGGSVVVWDRGHWFPEGDPEVDYKRGHLKFRLEGEKLRGGFALVRMHGRRDKEGADNWLLLKHADADADEDGERLVRDRPESVLSQRTVEEVAADPDRMWRSKRAGRKGGAQTLGPAERKAHARAPRPQPAPPSSATPEDLARRRLGLPPLTATARKRTSAPRTRATAERSTKSAKSMTKARTRSATPSATKVSAKTATKAPAKRSAKTATKAPAKRSAKTATKAPAKRSAKTATKAPAKRSAKTATKAPARRPTRGRKASIEEPGPAVRAAARPAAHHGDAHLPTQIAPELATLVDAVPRGAQWLHEVKYDGYRLIARVDGERVALRTRRGEDWSARFPWLTAALRARIPVDTALLDGELVHLGADGVTRFGELQRALAAERHASLVYFAFDLLHLDGHDLRPLPLERRKQALAELLPPEPRPGRVRLSEHILGQGVPLFDRACKLGLEGVISKRRDAPYRSGRFRDWLKVKCGKRQELVVGGFTLSRTGTRELGSLLLGVHDDAGAFLYSGKVGSGFDLAGAARLRARLEPLRTRSSPFSALPPEPGRSNFVRPEVVVEVRFTDWTADGRMRHPVFEGVREDRRPQDIRREEALPTPSVVEPTPAPPVRPRKAGAAPARSRGPAAEVLGVRITHPDRVLYPADGITKRDLAEYYAATADWLLPWVAGRPISIVRCPDAIDKPCFFQKHIHHELPPGVRTADLDGDAPFLYIEDAQGLVALTQVGTVELHIWGSTVARPGDPDRIILDLDPDPAVPWERVKATALALRTRLEDLDLVSFLKTTGGKGLHVVVPLIPGKQDWDQVKGFARGLALELARAAPELFTATASKAGRTGKIYIDYLRNYRGSTSVAPYSTRARAGAPVSVPLRWDELAALESSHAYTLKNLAARLGRVRRDPWQALPAAQQFLRAAALRAVVRPGR